MEEKVSGTVEEKVSGTENAKRTAHLFFSEARRIVGEFVHIYNHDRLHSAIGYVTPADMLAGRAKEIHEDRDRKLAEARNRRSEARQAARGETAKYNNVA